MTLCESVQRHKVQLLVVLLLLGGLYSTIVPAMVLDWYHDDNYSHGFLVPFLAGYFLYRQRRNIMEAETAPASFGLVVILLALVQLIVAWLGMEFFTLRSSLVVLIAGLVLFFFGAEAFKAARLPIFYLLFMVPLPYILYDALAFPLKLLVTRMSVWFLQMIGVAVMREGNIITFPFITLEVADACSGIRSLISLLALAVAYAFFIKSTTFKRLIIILSAVPIAILTNAIRVVGTGLLAQYWGARAAEGFFHEFAGLAVFALAVALLVGIGAGLQRFSNREGH